MDKQYYNLQYSLKCFLSSIKTLAVFVFLSWNADHIDLTGLILAYPSMLAFFEKTEQKEQGNFDLQGMKVTVYGCNSTKMSISSVTLEVLLFVFAF